MTKLSDVQLVILSHASQREDLGVATIGTQPEIRPALTKLLKAKLLTTVPKTSDLALWDRCKDGGPLSLTITPAGLEAVGVDASTPMTASAKTPRTKGGNKVAEPKVARTTGKAKPTGAGKQHGPAHAGAGVRSGTKLDAIISLLKRPKGASLSEMMKATGWQAHSVRGVMSGALKKKLKLKVTSDIEGDVRRYRIAG